METVNIVGAGLAGLSAALTLSRAGIKTNLISVQASERAQSVLAEGGINGVLDCMGEGDTVEAHFADTMKAGCYLADERAVMDLVSHAPGIISDFKAMGVPFNSVNGVIQQRNFGGQKKKRTAFVKSSTGKTLMTALIDKVRFYEAKGLVIRYSHHNFEGLGIENGTCHGVYISDVYYSTSADVGTETFFLEGPVILAFGGMNGLFPGHTTGVVTNSGEAVAKVFSQGVKLSNLEMIQYHPTTIGICGKRCLVSEAARGEGGRLYIERDGKPWFFMEERYPELGNLMPRDVVAREMYFVSRDPSCAGQVYLDLTRIPSDIWKKRLSDLRSEITDYLKIDPVKQPVPVAPAIHYFMGGIDVDIRHRTNIRGLYAAGECCSQYHGANRLGGNSTLAAVYGGRAAASDIIENPIETEGFYFRPMPHAPASPRVTEEICRILTTSMGIVRNGSSLKTALAELKEMKALKYDNANEINIITLSQAIVMSALLRRESRGAHYREDFPKSDDAMRHMTAAVLKNGEAKVEFKE